eukprot:CAMPEP_0198332372 /NCGR_PEP_ID=MMETSP1450-20131203/18239_1 /TAXON_ID=753684 ORGANISM="Madagascaria erythrocladiodes, Strain CCMP3234" /NCGR_SAMPLE_ID=MMETSP1450 /ASSEMBLY_ACC=CAM_ASM_001115 /LENGTH=92 /DNA_ID=CAMNT_0044036819 /DNA_START=86 /DNA_END=361 /DNA_ORIENTATION=+
MASVRSTLRHSTLLVLGLIALCAVEVVGGKVKLAPYCCDLTEGTAQRFNQRRVCSKGRGYYCMARYSSGRWYCVTPQYFASNSRYTSECAGG